MYFYFIWPTQQEAQTRFEKQSFALIKLSWELQRQEADLSEELQKRESKESKKKQNGQRMSADYDITKTAQLDKLRKKIQKANETLDNLMNAHKQKK
ncbi:MAG: hypothetical protein H6850_01740 [Alphaproteobacteria bacterium]|nr:MAG: hypothetical protein H6850_01740 [Alphaproteobacteria bacterium]